MKKRVSKLLALALTATMLLSACGNNSGEAAETGKPEEEKAPTEQTGDKAEASAGRNQGPGHRKTGNP